LIVLPLMVLLLPSCGWRGWRSERNATLNDSALLDPVTITMLPSIRYQFKEGVVVGRGQKFHSDYSYQRAVIIGNQ
jgi:hypothetical protein